MKANILFFVTAHCKSMFLSLLKGLSLSTLSSKTSKTQEGRIQVWKITMAKISFK